MSSGDKSLRRVDIRENILYTNNKLAEREIRNAIPPKRIKCLGINFIKGVKDLYSENYKK